MIRHGEAPFLECSSKGDNRFSAFYAIVNGKSIEEIYQAFKVFEDGSTGLTWREAKGKKAINQEECNKLYSRLWNLYIFENHELLHILAKATGLSDIFGKEGSCCQATELWRIRNDYIDFFKKYINANDYTVITPTIFPNSDGRFYEFAKSSMGVTKPVYFDGKVVGSMDIASCGDGDSYYKVAIKDGEVLEALRGSPNMAMSVRSANKNGNIYPFNGIEIEPVIINETEEK